MRPGAKDSEMDLIVQYAILEWKIVLTPNTPPPSLADDGLPTSPKQQREPAQRADSDCEDDTKQNYEDWKRKILENALKAKSSE